MNPEDREEIRDRLRRSTSSRPGGPMMVTIADLGHFPPSDSAGNMVYAAHPTTPQFDEQEGATATWDDGPGIVYVMDAGKASEYGVLKAGDRAVAWPVGDRWVVRQGASPCDGKIKLWVYGFGAGFDVGAGDGTRFHVKATTYAPGEGDDGGVAFEGDCADATPPAGPQHRMLPDGTPSPDDLVYLRDRGVTGYVEFTPPQGWYVIVVTDSEGFDPGYLYYAGSQPDSIYHTGTPEGYYDAVHFECDDVVVAAEWDVETYPVLLYDRLTWVMPDPDNTCRGKFAPVVGAGVTLRSTWNPTDSLGHLPEDEWTFTDTQETDSDGVAYPRYPNWGGIEAAIAPDSFGHIPEYGNLDWDAPGYDPESGTISAVTSYPPYGCLELISHPKAPQGPGDVERGVKASCQSIELCKSLGDYTKDADAPDDVPCGPKSIAIELWGTAINRTPYTNPWTGEPACPTFDLTAWGFYDLPGTYTLNLLGADGLPGINIYKSDCVDLTIPGPSGALKAVIIAWFDPLGGGNAEIRYAAACPSVYATTANYLGARYKSYSATGNTLPIAMGLDLSTAAGAPRPTSGPIYGATDPYGFRCNLGGLSNSYVDLVGMQVGTWSIPD